MSLIFVPVIAGNFPTYLTSWLVTLKVYGNNLEIQAMAEIYNRPIHIYSYSTGTFLSLICYSGTGSCFGKKSFFHLTDIFLKRYLDFYLIRILPYASTPHIASPSSDLSAVWSEPINIFHGSYETDLPPIRLSYHRGNHYNSIVDPCNPAVGVGLGFGSLRGVS